MVAQQGVGDDPFAAAEILARVARFDGRPLHTELLAVDTAVECIDTERIVRKDGQLAMPLLSRSLAACSDAWRRYCWYVASSTWYGMSLVRDMTRLPWFMAWATMTPSGCPRQPLVWRRRLQRRKCRQELALFIGKVEHVADVAKWHLLIKAGLVRRIDVGLGSATGQLLGPAIIVEMTAELREQWLAFNRELRQGKLKQNIELGVDGLAQPANVHLAELVSHLVEGHEFVVEAAVLQAIIR